MIKKNSWNWFILFHDFFFGLDFFKFFGPLWLIVLSENIWIDFFPNQKIVEYILHTYIRYRALLLRFSLCLALLKIREFFSVAPIFSLGLHIYIIINIIFPIIRLTEFFFVLVNFLWFVITIFEISKWCWYTLVHSVFIHFYICYSA